MDIIEEHIFSFWTKELWEEEREREEQSGKDKHHNSHHGRASSGLLDQWTRWGLGRVSGPHPTRGKRRLRQPGRMAKAV